MMTLTAAVFAASLAFAQSDIGTSNTSTGSASETSTTGQMVPDTATPLGTTPDTTTAPTNMAITTRTGDRGMGSTMVWLIPLVIILAIAFPFIRRRLTSNTNVTSSPRS